MIYIVPYEPEPHGGGIREILAKNGWEERYIAGQLAALDVISGDPRPETCGKVYVVEREGIFGGFVCVEFREWNRLGQLHGLAVDPDLKRRGTASALVRKAETFVREEGGVGTSNETQGNTTNTCPTPQDLDCTKKPPKAQGEAIGDCPA